MQKFLKPLFVLGCLNLGVLAAAITLLLHYELSMMGFPDGYISPEQRATLPLLGAIEIGTGVATLLFFVCLMLRNRPLALILASAALVLLIGGSAYLVVLGMIPFFGS